MDQNDDAHDQTPLSSTRITEEETATSAGVAASLTFRVPEHSHQIGNMHSGPLIVTLSSNRIV